MLNLWQHHQGHSAKNWESGVLGKLSKIKQQFHQVRFYFLADLFEKMGVNWQTQKNWEFLGILRNQYLSIFPENSCLANSCGYYLLGQLFFLQSVNMCFHACQTLLFVTHTNWRLASPAITSIIYVSHLSSLISCLLSLVSCLLSLISHLSSLISHLSSLISHLSSLISHCHLVIVWPCPWFCHQ
jgi:hypothetical protein